VITQDSSRSEWGTFGTPKPRTVIGILAFVSFTFVYNNVVLAPILLEIAVDLRTTAGAAGLLILAYAAPSVLTAHVLGFYSDRSVSRRPYLIGGSLVMGVGTLAGAVAPSFELLIATRAMSGLGVAMVMPNLNAALSDAFSYRDRGRAVGHTISAQTLATIGGIPVAGLVADLFSWRGSLAIVGVLTLSSTFILARYLPADTPRPEMAPASAIYRTLLTNRSAVASIVSAFLGAAFWFTWAAYFVAFFQLTYGLATSVASLLAAGAGGLGILIGSNIGGRLGDRVGHKRVLASALAIAGLLVIGLTNWPMGLVAAVLMNLLVCAASGARMPTNSAMLGEQVPAARATMFGLTWAAISVGVVFGTGSAGYLIDSRGFGALGLVAGTAALLSGLLVATLVREERPHMGVT